MYEKPPKDFSELFAPFSREITELGKTARTAILEALPNAEETVYGGKKIGNVLYAANGESKVVCGMQPTATFVRIFFHQWQNLTAAGYRIEGSGKNARHVKIANMADFDRFDIKVMLELAMK